MLVKEICNGVRNSTSTFTLMFDETTIKQKKQMDVLLRYFSETTNLVETRYLYLLSYFFARAPADFVVGKFQDLQNDKEYNTPWERLFNISSDGPNINKSIWQLLSDSLTSREFSWFMWSCRESSSFVHCKEAWRRRSKQKTGAEGKGRIK